MTVNEIYADKMTEDEMTRCLVKNAITRNKIFFNQNQNEQWNSFIFVVI